MNTDYPERSTSGAEAEPVASVTQPGNDRPPLPIRSLAPVKLGLKLVVAGIFGWFLTRIYAESLFDFKRSQISEGFSYIYARLWQGGVPHLELGCGLAVLFALGVSLVKKSPQVPYGKLKIAVIILGLQLFLTLLIMIGNSAAVSVSLDSRSASMSGLGSPHIVAFVWAQEVFQLIWLVVPFLYLSFLSEFALAFDAPMLEKQCRITMNAFGWMIFLAIAAGASALLAPSVFWIPFVLFCLTVLFFLVSLLALVGQMNDLRAPSDG